VKLNVGRSYESVAENEAADRARLVPGELRGRIGIYGSECEKDSQFAITVRAEG
jgi:hypothetical protein